MPTLNANVDSTASARLERLAAPCVAFSGGFQSSHHIEGILTQLGYLTWLLVM